MGDLSETERRSIVRDSLAVGGAFLALLWPRLSTPGCPRHVGRGEHDLTAIVVAGVGCYLLKLAGPSVPTRVLDRPWVRAATLVRLLAA